VDIVSLIITVVALAVGFFAGKMLSPGQQKITELESSLAEKERENQEYREQVAVHFSSTAQKFSSMTNQYRELYEHISTGAQDLCERRTMPRELATSHVDILAVESPNKSPELTAKKPEVNSEPSLVDVSKPGLSVITETNQKILEESKQEDQTADIIDLEAQRPEAESDDSGPAKDYAIKEKGVINHNSLNRDDVST